MSATSGSVVPACIGALFASGCTLSTEQVESLPIDNGGELTVDLAKHVELHFDCEIAWGCDVLVQMRARPGISPFELSAHLENERDATSEITTVGPDDWTPAVLSVGYVPRDADPGQRLLLTVGDETRRALTAAGATAVDVRVSWQEPGAWHCGETSCRSCRGPSDCHADESCLAAGVCSSRVFGEGANEVSAMACGECEAIYGAGRVSLTRAWSEASLGAVHARCFEVHLESIPGDEPDRLSFTLASLAGEDDRYDLALYENADACEHRRPLGVGGRGHASLKVLSWMDAPRPATAVLEVTRITTDERDGVFRLEVTDGPIR